VHVNISARHLAEPGFSELVAAALAESGLEAGRLELEITESTALFAAEATLRSVSEVTAAGVTLALDDFGTGYSAITALHRLPIHTVKIDRSFVADVVTEPSTAALVQGLLQLGHGMGLQVIAEGIEDLDQAAWLLDHGCAMAQGYAFPPDKLGYARRSASGPGASVRRGSAPGRSRSSRRDCGGADAAARWIHRSATGGCAVGASVGP
jgi:EAL domain-containing protein (putative c-di-GMP-specific phosphodiesterase class I)